MMFDSEPTSGAALLALLSERISADEFCSLASEGGFQAPNSLSVGLIENVIRSGQFPELEHNEFTWAIYESSYERLQGYSVAMRVFLSALYTYCNKRALWAISVESEYFSLGVEGLLLTEDQTLSMAYLAFLEWLDSAVTPADGYDNYFCLLSWAYVTAHAQNSDGPLFSTVLASIAAKSAITTDELLTDAQRGLSWWRSVPHELVGGEATLNRLHSVLPVEQ